MKVPCAENPGLSKVLSLRPGVDQNVALDASPTARNIIILILISALLVPFSSFFSRTVFGQVMRIINSWSGYLPLIRINGILSSCGLHGLPDVKHQNSTMVEFWHFLRLQAKQSSPAKWTPPFSWISPMRRSSGKKLQSGRLRLVEFLPWDAPPARKLRRRNSVMFRGGESWGGHAAYNTALPNDKTLGLGLQRVKSKILLKRK